MPFTAGSAGGQGQSLPLLGLLRSHAFSNCTRHHVGQGAGNDRAAPQPWGHPGVLGMPRPGWGLAQPTGVPVTVWEVGAVAACSLCVPRVLHAVSCHLRVLCVLPTCHCPFCVPSVCSVPIPCSPGGSAVTLACLPPVLVTRALHTQCTLKGRFPAGCGTSLESRQPSAGTLGQAPLPWACLPGACPFGIAARECAQNHTRVCEARARAQGVFG